MTPPPEPAPGPAAGADVMCVGVVHLYPGDEHPVVALRNVDLDIRAGEMLAVLGPSGSGKSTLLSLLSGLLRPTAGKVIVAGHDVGRMDPAGISRLRATELSLLLQEPLHNVIPYATAMESIAFAQRGARRRRWPVRWDPDDVVEQFGLGPVAHRPVHQLSGGEQQRVALATAMATSPRLLLCDEPTCQLDSAGRYAVIDALRHAHELSGATVVVVTHDAAVAEALPRTLTISDGAIGAEGRGGRRFAVVGSDGAVHLPAEVVAMYPPGTLFRVAVRDRLVELLPRSEEELTADPEMPEGGKEPR